MCSRFCLLLIIIVVCDGMVNAKSIRRKDAKETSDHNYPNDKTRFHYDNEIEPPILRINRNHQKSNPTPERPLASYWQNFVRNVRVPMPFITWNVTNPLATLFNINDNQPIIDNECSPTHTQSYYQNNDQLRLKQKRKRKHAHKRHHRNKRPLEHIETQPHINNNIDLRPHEEVLHQYINNADPTAAIYFFDPHTDAYYIVQRVTHPSAMKEDFNNYPNSPRDGENIIKPVINQSTQSDELENENDDDNENEHEQETISDENENQEINSDEMEEQELVKTKRPFLNEETFRDVSGGYMHNDHYNRNRHRTKDYRKGTSMYKQPRDNLKYYYVLNDNQYG